MCAFEGIYFSWFEGTLTVNPAVLGSSMLDTIDFHHSEIADVSDQPWFKTNGTVLG